MKAYIGRQPIFDERKRLNGYDLLYRNSESKSSAQILDGEAATREVLSDAVGLFGLGGLTDGLPAYIKFTRTLILNEFALMVPPDQIVVQILNDVTVDDLLVEKLQKLKDKGYRIALQGFQGQVRFKRISGLFDVVRIDCTKNNSIRRRELYDKMYRPQLVMIADRIERERDFDNAREIGFNLFSGYYFQRPNWLSKPRPQWNATSYGRLLGELVKPEPSLRACYAIIRSDIVLSYMLLRQMQTAQYYRGNVVKDLQQAIMMMGMEELRRWVCLVMMKQNNVTRAEEPARIAYTRGQFIERLMANSDTRLDHKQGFLLGMFSQLDKVMGMRIETLLADLELEPDMRDALLGKAENEYSLYLQYAMIYELGNTKLILPDIHTRYSEEQVQRLYRRCVEETDTLFASMEGL